MSITAETSKVLKKELERLKKEREEIDQTIKQIEGMIVSGTHRASSSVRRVIAPKAEKPKKSGKAWTPKGRAKQALELIKKNPGITASDIADKLKLKNNTAIYPALNKLVAEGFVEKKGKSYTASS